jgi:hypothetical protein
VRVAANSVEGYVGGDADVSRHFFPGELEVVFGHPHVVAAAGDGVGLRGGVVFGRPGVENFADVGVRFEHADGAAVCGGAWFGVKVGQQQADNRERR